MMTAKRILIVQLIAACLLVVICGTASFSGPQKEEFRPPILFGESSLAKADDLVRQGYTLLESGDLEGALAKFGRIGEVVISKWISEYCAACAYARTRHEEEALKKLKLIIGNGFDFPELLESESDFTAFSSSPEFKKLIEQARLNFETEAAKLPKRLPVYEQATDTFDTEEELAAWLNKQDRIHYLHRNVWTAVELLTAQIDMQARYLAALKMLKTGDPKFDYGLERVRASVRMKQLSRPGWGIVSDIVRREVDAYAQTSPPASALGEANFFAGMALSLKCKHDDRRRVEAYDLAANYLGRVEKKDQYYGAARALMAVNDLLSPGANEKEVVGTLRRVIEEFPGDQNIYTIISTRLHHDAARVLWPISLEVQDIDGKTVTLDEYRGRVVLIDFWAIMCVPCRKEIPKLVELYDKYREKGFEIISVSLDSKDRTTAQDLRRWVAENKMGWRHIYDGMAWKSDLVKRFFIGSVPTQFLVGPDGSLIAWGDACRGDSLVLNVQRALAARAD
jgi:thiol-disulfide isomerase/thioredoxin